MGKNEKKFPVKIQTQEAEKLLETTRGILDCRNNPNDKLTYQGAATKIKESIGEYKAREYVKRTYGDNIAYELAVPRRYQSGKGSPILDLVYVLKSGKTVVIEAKWGESGLQQSNQIIFGGSESGVTEISKAKTLKQFSPEWFQEKTNELSRKGGQSRRLANKLERAWIDGNIEALVIYVDKNKINNRIEVKKVENHTKDWLRFKGVHQTKTSVKKGNLLPKNRTPTGKPSTPSRGATQAPTGKPPTASRGATQAPTVPSRTPTKAYRGEPLTAPTQASPNLKGEAVAGFATILKERILRYLAFHEAEKALNDWYKKMEDIEQYRWQGYFVLIITMIEVPQTIDATGQDPQPSYFSHHEIIKALTFKELYGIQNQSIGVARSREKIKKWEHDNSRRFKIRPGYKRFEGNAKVFEPYPKGPTLYSGFAIGTFIPKLHIAQGDYKLPDKFILERKLSLYSGDEINGFYARNPHKSFALGDINYEKPKLNKIGDKNREINLKINKTEVKLIDTNYGEKLKVFNIKLGGNQIKFEVYYDSIDLYLESLITYYPAKEDGQIDHLIESYTDFYSPFRYYGKVFWVEVPSTL